MSRINQEFSQVGLYQFCNTIGELIRATVVVNPYLKKMISGRLLMGYSDGVAIL